MTTAGDGITALFVRRPVLAIVLNLLIVVAGLAAINGAEVRELPDVDRPVISISTDYDGAAPETVDREVTAIVESAAGRVSGLKSISASSEFGESDVYIEFGDSTDLNVAAADVRDAIAQVAQDLPEAADEPSIVKADTDASPILRLATTSTTLSAEATTALVDERITDRLTAIEGVAAVEVYGDREQIFQGGRRSGEARQPWPVDRDAGGCPVRCRLRHPFRVAAQRSAGPGSARSGHGPDP